MSSEPIRQPANDPIAFDISKRSPEQIAHLFARWKEQRKRLQAPEPRRKPPHLKPVPPIVHGAVEAAEKAAPVADTEPGRAVRYSASFEALLSAREPTLAQRAWTPDARLAKLARPHPPLQRSKTKWVLAGAASVVAAAAMAGGALWERSAEQPGWTEAGDKPNASVIAGPAEAAPTYPMDIPMAEPFVAQATAARQADWPMRQAVDLALMKSAPVAETAHLPLTPRLKPPVPVVRTASKPAAKPAAAAQPEDAPSDAPAARVELPLAPSVTTATVSVPVGPATETRDDDSRSNLITGRGNDKDNFAFGSNGRVASSGSKPAGASGSGGSADPGSGSGSTGGSGDPGKGGTGGDPGGGTGGSDPGGGDPGGGSGGGGGESGEGDSEGGEGSGGGEGGESGESGESGSDDDGGLGGAIGGAIGGLGDAIGGALGGGKGDSTGGKDDSKDKDKAD